MLFFNNNYALIFKKIKRPDLIKNLFILVKTIYF